MTTIPTRQHRTGPELIYVIADYVRAGRSIDDAILRALHGEHKARYVNLVAALSAELHCTPINKWDADMLPDPQNEDPLRQKDHPGAHAMRLDVWAARMHSPAAVAAALDDVANQMADELPAFMILGGAA